MLAAGCLLDDSESKTETGQKIISTHNYYATSHYPVRGRVWRNVDANFLDDS